MFDECIMDFGEPFKNTKSSLSANFLWYLTWCIGYFYHWFNEFNGLCPARCKTKTGKTPCVGCKMSLTSHWCCACLKILKQAWIFSVSYIITLQGLCIHRKAINKNKHQSSGWYPTTGKTSTCKAKWFIPVYRLGEDGGLHLYEGADMLLIWLLRACSYKTKAEA